MKSFDHWIKDHQTAWRKTHVETKELGVVACVSTAPAATSNGESAGHQPSCGPNQTSPDLGLQVNECQGLVLVEANSPNIASTSVRHGVTREILGDPETPTDRCKRPVTVAQNHTDQCHQSAWDRKYWDPLLTQTPPAPSLSRDAATNFRQQALAEGIARSGSFDLHERNEELDMS